MKAAKITSHSVLSILLVITLFSCASAPRASDSGQKKNDDYKIVKIVESTGYLETKIEYPEFASYPELSKRIRNTVENDWKGFRSFSQSGWTEISALNQGGADYPPFEYNTSFQVSNSGTIISVLLNNYTFSGGAHGSTSLIALNYDTAAGKFLSITEATGLDYNQLSEKCREVLYKRLIDDDKNVSTAAEIADMKENINTGAFPQAGNYQIFTLKGKKLTVYFEPYSVAPYVYGIQTVEIPLK